MVANTLGMPNLAGILVTRWRLLIDPIEFMSRRRGAQAFATPVESDRLIDNGNGFYMFPDNGAPDTRSIVGLCNRILDDKGRENLDSWYETRANSKSKSFFFNILEEQDLYRYPELMEYVLSDEVLQIVIPYYGVVPRLSSIGLYHSPVSESRSRSQNFHLDGTDP